MGGGGSIAGMIASLKANKALLGTRRSYFDAKKDYLRAVKGMKITYKEATKEELNAVKVKIRNQQKAEKRRVLIVLSIVVPIVFFGIYKMLDSVDKGIVKERIIEKDLLVEKYHFHINDGDKMIKLKKWNNAIFQYTRALEIFPNELDAQYRLSLAYVYKCQYENEGCVWADSLVSRLIIHFPNDIKIQDLKEALKEHNNFSTKD